MDEGPGKTGEGDSEVCPEEDLIKRLASEIMRGNISAFFEALAEVPDGKKGDFIDAVSLVALTDIRIALDSYGVFARLLKTMDHGQYVDPAILSVFGETSTSLTRVFGEESTEEGDVSVGNESEDFVQEFGLEDLDWDEDKVSPESVEVALSDDSALSGSAVGSASIPVVFSEPSPDSQGFQIADTEPPTTLRSGAVDGKGGIDFPVIPANLVPVVPGDVDDGDLGWELPEGSGVEKPPVEDADVCDEKKVSEVPGQETGPDEAQYVSVSSTCEIDISFMKECVENLNSWRMSMPETDIDEEEESFHRRVCNWLESAPKFASVVADDDNDTYQFMTSASAIDFFNRQLIPVKMGLIGKGIIKEYWKGHSKIKKFANIIEEVSCLQNVWVNTNKKGKRPYLTSEELVQVGCNLHPAFKNYP